MACAIVLGAASSYQADAALVGLWDFENSADLTAAQTGSALTLAGTNTAAAGSGGADAGASSLAGDGNHYTVTNPIGVNGGGATETNEYTILMDINTTAGGFNSLLDTDGGGDGDIFISGTGVGISSNYFGTATGGWHRVLLVFDLGSATPITTYIDGVLNHAHTGAELGGDLGILDGRWGLGATFDVFNDGDGTGEEKLVDVSNLALFDTSLSASQATALGGAGSAIVGVVPEPSTLLLTVMAMFGLLGVYRRKANC